MKRLIYNAITKETTFEELTEIQEIIEEIEPLVEEVPLDVRVAKVEQEQEQIVDVLAKILGV